MNGSSKGDRAAPRRAAGDGGGRDDGPAGAVAGLPPAAGSEPVAETVTDLNLPAGR
jgi:hypothetical protein